MTAIDKASFPTGIHGLKPIGLGPVFFQSSQIRTSLSEFDLRINKHGAQIQRQPEKRRIYLRIESNFLS